MAYAQFQQSDDVGSPPQAATAHCGSGSVGRGAKATMIGGVAGTLTRTFRVPGGGGGIFINWRTAPPATFEPSLLPGTWTVDLNVTSGNSYIRLNGLWICHESTGTPGETIADYTTAPGEQMTTGVHTITFGDMAPTWWHPGDTLYYVVSFSNGNFFDLNLSMKFDKLCVYPKAVDSWRGVTTGGGYADRQRDAII